MQKLLLTASLFIAAGSLRSQTLFTYGNKQVSKEEFVRAYQRNYNGPVTAENLQEYLDLYIRFKLKVQAAKDAKMDTLPHIKNDVAAFREQLIESYLRNEEEVNRLVKEAFERNREEIEIAHVFVAYGSDSLQAKNKIMEAWKQLQSGEAFEKVATTYSTNDYVKKSAGYVGYITAFTLPYALENVAYSLTPGSYSAPVNGPFGYHILRSISRRASGGLFKGAHILIAFPPGATRDVIEQRKLLADSVYHLLKNGADFAQLARQFSDDKTSYLMGGKLPEFNIAQYDAAFTQAAFALPTNGAFSPPVYTDHGYHIILRQDVVPPPADLSNPEVQTAFLTKVNTDSRINTAIEKMKKEILAKTGFQALSYEEKSLWALTDSVLKAGNNKKILTDQTSKTLFRLGGKNFTVSQWLEYAQKIKSNNNAPFYGTYATMMQNFIEETALEHYKANMEKYNPAFSAQIREFMEGNLLFEIMEKNIWSKAPADTAGLLAYYRAHAGKYIWEPSVSAIIYNCADTLIARTVATQMQNDPLQWKRYMDLYGGRAIADSGRFELTQLPLPDRSMPAAHTLTPIVVNEMDGSASFCYIVQTHPNKEPRSFEDAKGLIINDYQQVLEEKWIAALKKQYPVKVNQTVLQQILQHR